MEDIFKGVDGSRLADGTVVDNTNTSMLDIVSKSKTQHGSPSGLGLPLECAFCS